MDDTISRQAAIDEWKNDFKGYVNALDIPRDDYKGIMEYIDELPSAQPERKRGKWNAHKDCEGKTRRITCNLCGWQSHSLCWYDYNYCPNCGADMRGEKE